MAKKKTKTASHPALAMLAALDALAEQMEPLARRLLDEWPPREFGMSRRTDYLERVDRLRHRIACDVAGIKRSGRDG